MSSPERPILNETKRIRQQAKRFGAVTICAVAGASVGAMYYQTSTPTDVAGSYAELSGTLDGAVTVDLGPLPDVRFSANMPLHLGARLDIGNSYTPALSDGEKQHEMIDSLASSYGSFLARPEAEIQSLQDDLKRHLYESIGLGLLCALAGAGVIRYMGKEVGEMVDQLIENKRLLPLATALACTVAGLGTLHDYQNADREQVPFVPLVDKFPHAAALPFFDRLEIRDIPLTEASGKLVEGVLDSYTQSQRYFRDIKQQLTNDATQLHRPTEGQRVGIVISDRHDNILADALHARLAELGKASFVMNLGDNTASGSRYEAFSLRSLKESFGDMPMLAIVGNHDQGDFVLRYWQQHDVVTPTDGVIEENGIRFVMRNDYRTSDFTAERAVGDVSADDVAKDIAATTCGSGERVNVVMAPYSLLGRQALEQGCVDLVLGGDTHLQTQPEVVIGANGARGYEMTNGTSSGASYAFTLGKFRREASDTLVTFAADGTPVGVQIVRFATNGKVTIEPYQALKAGVDGGKKHFGATAKVRNGRVESVKLR